MVGAGVEQLDQVGVPQAGQRPYLGAAAVGAAEVGVAEHFDGDRVAGAGVDRGVHVGHPAAPEQAPQRVGTGDQAGCLLVQRRHVHLTVTHRRRRRQRRKPQHFAAVRDINRFGQPASEPRHRLSVPAVRAPRAARPLRPWLGELFPGAGTRTAGGKSASCPRQGGAVTHRHRRFVTFCCRFSSTVRAVSGESDARP